MTEFFIIYIEAQFVVKKESYVYENSTNTPAWQDKLFIQFQNLGSKVKN